MKWSSYTLRAAAVIQGEIERLEKVLAELLQWEGTAFTASNGSKNHASVESWTSGPLGTTVAAPKTLDVEPSALSAFEFLDEVLFWGNQFSGPEPKLTQYTPTYCLQGLKRVDTGPVANAIGALIKAQERDWDLCGLNVCRANILKWNLFLPNVIAFGFL
jgi:hypothetical protein